MAIGTPFLVIKATLATFGATARTLLQAIVAMAFVAAGALRHALIAKHAVAVGAVVVTFSAHGRVALLASQLFVVGDHSSAVGARNTVPFVKRHEWAVGVVGSQQVGDDHEKVEQAALLKRVADRLFPLALANGFVLDVRMRNALVARRRVGFRGDHPIVTGMTVGQIAPIKAYFNGPEIDAVQLDRLRGDRNGLAGLV
jgi:hypothetical protein